MRKLSCLSIILVMLLLYVSQIPADIAFISKRDGERNLYVMNDHGGNLRKLTDTPLKKTGIAWSRDGNQIAYTLELSPGGGPGKQQRLDVFIMNADGTQQQNLTEHISLDGYPSWSPDGKFIAFISSRDEGFDIYTIEIKTRKVRRLTRETGSYSPDWSPDGNSIVYAHTLEGQGRHIYIMNADGSRKRPLLRKLRKPQFGDATILSYRPKWSPDGEYVLYIEDDITWGVGWNATNVIVVDKQGLTPRVLNIPRMGRVDSVCWTDDGEAVLFTAIPNGFKEAYDIYKYQLRDGLITTVMTHPSDHWSLAWTPHRSFAVPSKGKLTVQWARIKLPRGVMHSIRTAEDVP